MYSNNACTHRQLKMSVLYVNIGALVLLDLGDAKYFWFRQWRTLQFMPYPFRCCSLALKFGLVCALIEAGSFLRASRFPIYAYKPPFHLGIISIQVFSKLEVLFHVIGKRSYWSELHTIPCSFLVCRTNLDTLVRFGTWYIQMCLLNECELPLCVVLAGVRGNRWAYS